MPTPKWKLVVDIGSAPPKLDAKAADKRIPDVLKVLADSIPTHQDSPFAPYLPGFTALRLLLLKRNRTPEENDLANTMLDSYSSYLTSGRNSSETGWMVARDFMLLTQTPQHNAPMPQIQSIHHQPTAQQQEVQQLPLQQQLGQGQSVTTVQQQHNALPLTQHIQQLHSNQYQQIDTIQNGSHQIQIPNQNTVQHQQNAVSIAPLPMSAPAIHSAMSTLGHFATHTTQNSQNSLSQNGIAALSHLSQQHQMTNANGISTLLSNDKSGVPGV